MSSTGPPPRTSLLLSRAFTILMVSRSRSRASEAKCFSDRLFFVISSRLSRHEGLCGRHAPAPSVSGHWHEGWALFRGLHYQTRSTNRLSQRYEKNSSTVSGWNDAVELLLSQLCHASRKSKYKAICMAFPSRTCVVDARSRFRLVYSRCVCYIGHCVRTGPAVMKKIV